MTLAAGMHPLITVAIPAVACAAAAGALAYASIAPTCAFWGPVVQHGDRGGAPRYALTFDDGPSAESTPRILDTLGELSAKAAFFVIGLNVRRAPEIVRRMYAEGHVVANHSYDHSHFGMMRVRRYWERQFRETDGLIEEIIGVRPAMFRPPMGVRTGHIANAARRHGHTLVTWSRRALDGIPTTAERIVARLAGRTVAGDILVLHDGVEPNVRRDPSATVAAMRPLILGLRERGLEPARLDELTGVAPYAAPSRAAAAG
jgi:peptidoglycan/xylan/chitin deacetylase (PgdA/CDA1 family)